MKSLIKAIIVTYNSAGPILECLAALGESGWNFGLDITIVDNASSDNTVRLVQAQNFAGLEVLALNENRGYAGGNNAALRAIADYKKYAAILIMNPDILLPVGALDQLMALLESDPLSGMVSPAVCPFPQASEAEAAQHIRKRRSLWGGPGAKLWTGQSGLKNVFVVDRLPGCCLLVKPALFEKVGLFDEAYFLYWEELDLALRARRAGYRLLTGAHLLIQHNLGEAERPHRVYYMYRNQFYYAFKNYNGLFARLFLLRRLGLSNSRELVKFYRTGRKDLLRAGWAGLKAARRGETGPALLKFT